MELWFVLSVTVALFWGSSGIFAKYSTHKIGVAGVALLIAVVEGIMYFTAFYFLRDEDVPISLADGILATSSCVIGISGYLCYFESIVDGQVAIAGTISAAYPALTVIGALLLLSESLTAVQTVGVIVIIGCVIALSYEPDPNAKHAMPRRALFFSFMAFGLWGVWSLTSKMAVDEVGAGNMFGFYIISSLTAPVLYAWVRRIRPSGMRRDGPTRIAWMFGAVALVLNVVGAFAFTYALEASNASLVVPISSAYTLVTILIAVVNMKENRDILHNIALCGVVSGL
ncbi:MAG: DMT family transporter, partial [Thermoplasmata archaeon]